MSLCSNMTYTKNNEQKLEKDGSISLHIIASVVLENKNYEQSVIESKKLNGTGQHEIESHHAQGIVINFASSSQKIPSS